MTEQEEQLALNLLLKEGKSKDLAQKIIEINKKKEHKQKEKKGSVEDEILLEYQKDIPRKILKIPPPTLLLIIDNATVNELQEIIGTSPLRVKAQCVNTKEGMNLLFKYSKLLKMYPRKWNCTSIYIGGLYSAYNFCSSADLVVAVKMKNVWDRDMKILHEMEKVIGDYKDDFVVAHVLGLDFCKDHNLNNNGAILILKKLIKSILSTNYNIVLTSDHSGEEFIPYYEVFTHSHSIN